MQPCHYVELHQLEVMTLQQAVLLIDAEQGSQAVLPLLPAISLQLSLQHVLLPPVCSCKPSKWGCCHLPHLKLRT